MNGDEVILERLLLLREEVAYLKAERGRLGSFGEYQGDRRLRKAVERSLQVAVEACLDIGRRPLTQGRKGRKGAGMGGREPGEEAGRGWGGAHPAWHLFP